MTPPRSFKPRLAPIGRRAVVKLIPEAAVDGAAPLDLWFRTRQLRHPNLIELLDCGRAESPRRNRPLRRLRISRRYPRLRAQPIAAHATGSARSPRFRPRRASLPPRARPGARRARSRPRRCRRRPHQALHRCPSLRRHLVRLPPRRPPARPPLAALSHVRLPEKRGDRGSRRGPKPANPLDAGRNQHRPEPAAFPHSSTGACLRTPGRCTTNC